MLNNDQALPPQPVSQNASQVRWWKAITKRQWVFLIAILVIWILLVALFLFVILKGQV